MAHRGSHEPFLQCPQFSLAFFSVLAPKQVQLLFASFLVIPFSVLSGCGLSQDVSPLGVEVLLTYRRFYF